MSDSIYETDNYSLIVKDIPYDGEQSLGYVIFNKQTKVEEYNTFILPEALFYIGKFQDDLDEFASKEIADKLMTEH